MNAYSKLNSEVLESAYSMHDYLYFDIETIPSQDPAHLERLKAEISAPNTLKKKESIDAWLAENRESAAIEAMNKTSFDGGRGHVCTIAWAINDGPLSCRHITEISEEKQMLDDFFSDISGYHSRTLVGHNISGFDLPFITKRAVCLGVELPPKKLWPRDVKPWSKEIADTMAMWAGAGRISLDRLCDILGIPGKDGFDGSKVAGAWADGLYDKISEYCRDDVWRTREIHKRFLAAGF